MSRTHIISAVIPAYNSAAFIADAVGSIRAQTRQVDEIIVVDDGSTDDTATTVQRLGDGIQYLHQANAGPSAARNRGIEAARGDLIAFLDADDQWTRTKIEQQLAVMEQNPAIALVAGDMAEIDSQDNITVPSVLNKHSLLVCFKDLGNEPIPNALALLLKTNFIPTGTVLARCAALEEAGGFTTDIRYGEDLELWAKLAAQHAIACLPEVLMLRRQHGENVTQATEPLLRDLIKVMSSLRAWDAKQLRQQSVDPNRLVAEAWGNLGYWQFSSGRLPDARQAFHSSLKEKATLRALLYSALCIIPERLVYSLRHFKQVIDRKG
jgi:hypothetical protein